jgi:hypothetical protein
MKYEYMFMCLIISGLGHLETRINVMLKPLMKELKSCEKELNYMTMSRSKNSTFELRICGRFMILGCTIFFQDEVTMKF